MVALMHDDHDDDDNVVRCLESGTLMSMVNYVVNDRRVLYIQVGECII